MKYLAFLLANTVSLYLSILLFLLMIRSIMSMFIQETDSKPVLFVFGATEPIILPIRSLLSRIEFFQSIPIDFSVIISFLIIWLLKMFI